MGTITVRPYRGGANPFDQFDGPDENAARLVQNDPPPMQTNRPPVQSSARVWGDADAEAMGLYETPGASPHAVSAQARVAPPQANPFDQFDNAPPQERPTDPFSARFDQAQQISAPPPELAAAMQAKQQPDHKDSSWNATANAGLGSLIEGVPVVGPIIRGGLDRAGAGIRSVMSGQPYEAELKHIQGWSQQQQKDRPVLDTAAQIGGGVAGTIPLLAAAPVAMGIKGASMLGRVLAGGTSGAVLSGADAAVRSGGDLSATGMGAAAGGALGVAGPVAGKVIGSAASSVSQWFRTRAADKVLRTTPSTEVLKEQSQELYDLAGKAGVTIAPHAFGRFTRTLAGELRGEGIDASLHPRAVAALSRLVESEGKSLTLQETDTLRKVISAAAGSADPDERRIASIMRNRLDDWLTKLGDGDVLAGDRREAVLAIRGARDLWGQAKRGEEIEKIMERARQSASGYEAGLRNEFRALAKSETRMRGFSDAEKAAIKAVASGTPIERAARLVGKLAPNGVVSLALSGGMGTYLGGMEGGAAALATGIVAKGAANRMTRQAAERAAALARSGRAGQNALLPPPSPVIPGQIDQATSLGALSLIPLVNRQ